MRDILINREDRETYTTSPVSIFPRSIKCFFVLILIGGLLIGCGSVYWVQQWREFSQKAFCLYLKEAFFELSKNDIEDLLRISLALHQDQPAEEYYQRLLSMEPENAELTLNLALFYSHRERHDEALELYERLPKHYFMTPDLCFFYGLALSSFSRHEEALQWYYKSFGMFENLDNVEAIIRTLFLLQRPSEGLSVIYSFNSKYPRYEKYFKYYESLFSELLNKASPQLSKEVSVPEVEGHYYVPVTFSLFKEPVMYLVDTGATFLTIPKKIYQKKIDTARPTGEKVVTIDANNHKRNNELIILTRVKIGSITLKNVKAILCDECTPLLGQSVLNRLDISTQNKQGRRFLYLKN